MWPHLLRNEVSDGPRKGWGESFIREKCLQIPPPSDDSVTILLFRARAVFCVLGGRGLAALGRFILFSVVFDPRPPRYACSMGGEVAGHTPTLRSLVDCSLGRCLRFTTSGPTPNPVSEAASLGWHGHVGSWGS